MAILTGAKHQKKHIYHSVYGFSIRISKEAHLHVPPLPTAHQKWLVFHHKHQPLHDRINPKDCQVKKPLVIQGFSNFLGLFQVIMANPGLQSPSDNGNGT